MNLFGNCNVYYYPKKQNKPYKIVMHKQSFRNYDFDLYLEKEKKEKNSDEGEKLMNNISRAKTKIRDYALCNDWSYFVTLTFSDEKIDRYNLKEIKKKVGQFFNNYKKRKNNDFKYLLVPEFHADGAVHFHGLLSGINKSDLKLFDINDNIPSYIKNKLLKGLEVYDFLEYKKRFGYTVVEPVRNSDASAHYITKYVTKDLLSLPLGSCCYLNSKGLKTPELLHQDFGGVIPDNKEIYQNDFVAILWLENLEEYQKIMMM